MADVPLVLVCGSRSWSDSSKIEERLAQFPRGTYFLHGVARGADRLAGSVARRLGYVVVEYPAHWRVNGIYNPRAGFERNLRMLDQAPYLVLAFWDGRSTGTAHTIAEARRRGIPVEIVEEVRS